MTKLKLAGGKDAVSATQMQPEFFGKARGRPSEELTPAVITRLAGEADSASDTYIADTVAIGLKVRKAKYDKKRKSAGRLTFVFIGRVRRTDDHKLVNRTLGPARGRGALTIAAARAKAVALRDKLADAVDPLMEQRARLRTLRREEQTERATRKADELLSKWTLAKSAEHFIEWRQTRPEKKLAPKTVSFYRECISYVPDLHDVAVETITTGMIRTAIDVIPTVAKRAKARRALSTVIGHALEQTNSDKFNPVKRLRRGEYAPPAGRRTYLDEDGIVGYVHSCGHIGLVDDQGKKDHATVSEQTVKDYLLLNLLCAPRKTELMRLEWVNVDMQRRCYTVPDTKTHEGYLLPMTEWTAGIFLRRHKQRTKNPYVFPGRLHGKPVTDVRSALAQWFPKGYVLHDSRRTMATHCPALNIVGIRLKHLLHHKSADITEGGYTQAVIETMRVDLQKYHDWILELVEIAAQIERDPGSLDEPMDDSPTVFYPGVKQ